MNRSRLIYRKPGWEGTDEANAAALALAQLADRELIENLIHHLSALREFGGEVHIGAARARFDDEGKQSDEGQFHTYAYVIGYTEKSRVKSNVAEPDQGITQTPAPFPEPVAEDEPEED